MVRFLRRYWGSFTIVIVVAIVVAAIGLLVLNGSSQATNGTLYTVRRGNISAVVRTTGKVEPVRQTRLTFRTSETLRRILVKPGDFVPAGTLIMELDTTQLEKQLAQAQTQREIAQFNLSAQAERAQNNPNATPAPISELYSNAAQSQLADAQVASARAAIDNARLYAPYDGTILSIDAAEGDNINFGQPVATFADLGKLQVRADVDEIDVANVATGQQAQFTLDAFPGKSFDGRVTLIAPSPTQRQGSTIYQSVISFNKPDNLYIRPGMAANITITSLSRSNVLLVPNRALETIGLRRYVTIQNPDGTQGKVPVETGLNNPDQTEIISGLKEGDRIVIPR
ncbi:MAG TPA: efflux RND transporter periplasmic adaptor subunit [Chloroflexia bacterium]|nr:efflux RND transporter periplasmic adaptor subunit [Chloroflexia bacterium]